MSAPAGAAAAAAPASVTVHPFVLPVRSLLGRWRGRGRGEFPTIAAFEYDEEVRFTQLSSGRPVLQYTQSTQHPLSHQPMHGESGFWRFGAAQTGEPQQQQAPVELCISQASGITEICEGEMRTLEAEAAAAGGAVTISVTSSSVARCASSKSAQQHSSSSGQEAHAASALILCASSACCRCLRPPHVTGIHREFSLVPAAGSRPAQLRYTVSMATDSTPAMTPHLQATLSKVEEEEERGGGG